MSHALWAQRTPRMAYHVQGRAVFHAAWKPGQSPVGLKYSGGVLHPHILPRKMTIRPDYFYQNSGRYENCRFGRIGSLPVYIGSHLHPENDH